MGDAAVKLCVLTTVLSYEAVGAANQAGLLAVAITETGLVGVVSAITACPTAPEIGLVMFVTV